MSNLINDITECPICYENKRPFYSDSIGCINYKKICKDCMPLLRSNKCPFCRNIHHNRNNRHFNNRYNFNSTYSIFSEIANDDILIDNINIFNSYNFDDNEFDDNEYSLNSINYSPTQIETNFSNEILLESALLNDEINDDVIINIINNDLDSISHQIHNLNFLASN